MELPPNLFTWTDCGTIEAWVKLNQITRLPKNFQRIFSYGKAGHDLQLGFAFRSRKPFFQLNDPALGRVESEVDNRLRPDDELKVGEWATRYVDFARDARRNDGTANSPFADGNLVDDLFFFVDGEGAKSATLFLDEVVLFDGGAP